MEQQAALLNALDFAVDYFRKVQSERNEALTRLRQLEQEVNVLRVLTSGLRADRSSPLSTRRLSSAATIDLEGRFNRGCRDRVVKWLAATLRQSSDPDVRRWAAITLGVIGDSRTVPVLALAMQDANREVRREAVIALGRIGNASVVGSLAEALKDKDEEVRIKAMEALTKVGEPAIPAMIAALGAPDALVRRGA
ncbi:MAG: HEAT repeat domain-containing protein, partial [Dehalococcoidia bacterium]|nr:HEAT repeat domain-containing protein [Dehalococcoidia bacterium]